MLALTDCDPAWIGHHDYPSKGTGELGTFFYDSEGNLIGIAQPVREGSTRA
jgi:hypothetical protein